jgi:hypothetical protein
MVMTPENGAKYNRVRAVSGLWEERLSIRRVHLLHQAPELVVSLEARARTLETSVAGCRGAANEKRPEKPGACVTATGPPRELKSPCTPYWMTKDPLLDPAIHSLVEAIHSLAPAQLLLNRVARLASNAPSCLT